MYCKNCGEKLDQNAKFCPKCGTQTNAQNNYTAPTPFGQNSVDESQNPQFQKTAFKGKQQSFGTSGSVSFNNPQKRRGFFGKLFRLSIIVVVIVVAIVFIASLFGGPITNVESGTGIDTNISDLTGKTDTFATNTAAVYILFDYEDLESGDTLYLNLFYEDDEYSMDSYYFDLVDTVGWGYIGFPNPGSGWQVGRYTVEFVIDDDLIETYTFTVE